MTKLAKRSRWASLLGTMLVLGVAHAAVSEGGISFSRNRLVYTESDRAISLDVINHGDLPYLIQAGVSGDPDKKMASPFIVTPPLFRLNGNAQNTMRLVGSGAGLPRDRESVFYFYATAIPGQAAPTADKEEGAKGTALGAQLAIAMKTVLKVFYRPGNLPITINQAHGLMTFSREGNTVVIHNPTPYYQSFAVLDLDGEAQDLNSKPSMVAPFGEWRIPAGHAVRTVTWRVMNDYGGMTDSKTETLTKS